MKHTLPLLALTALLGLSGCTKTGESDFINKTLSDYNASETITRFTKALAPKEYKVLHILNHTPAATKEKMYLKPTFSVDLSNPLIDSKLLDCNPTMAVDLPLRIGVYRELSGKVTLVYTNPEYWTLKHNMKDANCLKLVKIMARDLDIATEAIHKKAP